MKPDTKDLKEPLLTQFFATCNGNGPLAPICTIQGVYIKNETVLKGYLALQKKLNLVASGLDEFNDFEMLAAEILLQQMKT